MNNISFSPQAAIMIGGFEGFSAKPYPDPATHGEPITIAYGSTHYCDGRKVTMQDQPLDKSTGLGMILCYLNNVILPNFKQHITVNLNQHQIDALGCLCYNIGNTNFDSSTLLKQINSHANAGTLQQFWLSWDHAGGKVIGGLLDRRTKEYNYFIS